MSDFWFYFQIGVEHILGAGAWDHQLFILALAIVFIWKDWREILVLVTAFTIGHSLTLVLSVLDIIRFNSSWVEFLIPCTIVITAMYHFFFPSPNKKNFRISYAIALAFGLIHGMGFANTIRVMLASDQSIGVGLFAFNIGLEVGQIVVVLFIIAVTWLMLQKLKVNRKYWIMVISGLVALISMQMAWSRWPM
jgi:hypothetical protein